MRTLKNSSAARENYWDWGSPSMVGMDRRAVLSRKIPDMLIGD
jgi:hypothetical protein